MSPDKYFFILAAIHLVRVMPAEFNLFAGVSYLAIGAAIAFTPAIRALLT